MTEPMPGPGKEDVFALLRVDLEGRNAKGINTYGRTLLTFNGRNALQDAYEEALDQAVYLRQALAESAVMVDLLRSAYEELDDLLGGAHDVRKAMRDTLGPDPEAWR